MNPIQRRLLEWIASESNRQAGGVVVVSNTSATPVGATPMDLEPALQALQRDGHIHILQAGNLATGNGWSVSPTPSGRASIQRTVRVRVCTANVYPPTANYVYPIVAQQVGQAHWESMILGVIVSAGPNVTPLPHGPYSGSTEADAIGAAVNVITTAHATGLTATPPALMAVGPY